MIRALPLALLFSVTACAPPGPTEAEIAANKQEKTCARLYEGQTKVFRDALYKQRVPEDKVKFADKDGYVKKCVEADFTLDQMRCIDPNLRDQDCVDSMKEVAEKELRLKKFLFGPMTEAAKEGSGAPAGDAAAPTDGAKKDATGKE